MKATILVVEDHPEVRRFTSILLQRNGYDVIAVESGEAVVRSWPEYGARVDLVLTDLMLPDGMSGDELATQLRERTPALPVVFTSGYGANARVSDQPLVEGQNFVPKPAAPELVLRAIRFSLSAR